MKNIIFDVGNVLVKWDPVNIIRQAFPDLQDGKHLLPIFVQVMKELDIGNIDFAQARIHLQDSLNTSEASIENLFNIFLSSLTILPETVELLAKLAKKPEFSLYCLTNMSRECFVSLQRYDFWQYFKGVVVSADIKLIKPDPKIYDYILTKFALNPRQTVFIDDILENIQAAENIGIHGIHFTEFSACQNQLRKLNII